MNCGNFSKRGDLEITVTRIGTAGVTAPKLPIQLFGSIDGVAFLGQEGILAGYVPAYDGDNTADKKAYFDHVTGDLLITDNSGASEVGVRISCDKIPYKTLLKHIENEGKSSSSSILIENTQLSYNTLKSISNSLTIRDRGIFSEENKSTISLRTSFDKDQQQAQIIDVTEIIEVMPSTSIDSFMSPEESLLSFNFTMSKIGE